MIKKIIILTVLILLPATTACDKGSDPAVSTDTACRKLIQYCPTGYSWSAYVTDQASCVAAFDCVADYYSGSCRDTLMDGFSCLADMASSSGCGACDVIISSLQSSCPYPSACF